MNNAELLGGELYSPLPKHKPLSFPSVQQNFCNICCAKHWNVGWAGFAATVTKTPCMHCHNRTLWNWQQPNGEGILLATWEKTVNPRTLTNMHMSTSVSSCQVPKPNTNIPNPCPVHNLWVMDEFVKGQPQPKSHMQTRNTTSLKKIVKQHHTLSTGSAFTPLSKRSSTIGREPRRAASWRGVFPHCQNTNHSVFPLCNKISAIYAVLNTWNVDWAGFAATVTKTPCNALPQ